MDENLPQRIAKAARLRGLDVTSAHELGAEGIPDDKQLTLAAHDGRCVVTRDVEDFFDLSRGLDPKDLPHAGVLILSRSLRDSDIGGIVRALEHINGLYPDGLPAYCVMYLTPAPS